MMIDLTDWRVEVWRDTLEAHKDESKFALHLENIVAWKKEELPSSPDKIYSFTFYTPAGELEVLLSSYATREFENADTNRKRERITYHDFIENAPIR